jgi:metal-responsive CopG/Arc/MetJ family transcriptional regulator
MATTDMREQVSLTLDRALLARIDELRERERRNRSNMIEVLLVEAIEARMKEVLRNG